MDDTFPLPLTRDLEIVFPPTSSFSEEESASIGILGLHALLEEIVFSVVPAVLAILEIDDKDSRAINWSLWSYESSDRLLLFPETREAIGVTPCGDLISEIGAFTGGRKVNEELLDLNGMRTLFKSTAFLVLIHCAILLSNNAPLQSSSMKREIYFCLKTTIRLLHNEPYKEFQVPETVSRFFESFMPIYKIVHDRISQSLGKCEGLTQRLVGQTRVQADDRFIIAVRSDEHKRKGNGYCLQMEFHSDEQMKNRNGKYNGSMPSENSPTPLAILGMGKCCREVDCFGCQSADLSSRSCLSSCQCYFGDKAICVKNASESVKTYLRKILCTEQAVTELVENGQMTLSRLVVIAENLLNIPSHKSRELPSSAKSSRFPKLMCEFSLRDAMEYSAEGIWHQDGSWNTACTHFDRKESLLEELFVDTETLNLCWSEASFYDSYINSQPDHPQRLTKIGEYFLSDLNVSAKKKYPSFQVLLSGLAALHCLLKFDKNIPSLFTRTLCGLMVRYGLALLASCPQRDLDRLDKEFGVNFNLDLSEWLPHDTPGECSTHHLELGLKSISTAILTVSSGFMSWIALKFLQTQRKYQILTGCRNE